MKNQFLKLVGLGLILLSASADAQTTPKSNESGSGDVQEVKDKSRGADPEIKVGRRPNQEGMQSKAVQSTDKGARARGGLCTVTFDNFTQWYLDCYVDGYLEGYVSPYGKGSVTVAGGDTRAYVKAEFNDGSYKYWGPITRYCNYSEFELKIYSGYYNHSIK